MAALKDQMGAEAVASLGRELRSAHPGFPLEAFEAGAAEALAPLVLSGRVAWIAGRLAEALPSPFAEGAEVVRRALASPGFDGWITWPVGTWVASAGLTEPDVALPLLAALTPRWSSEFAIRPFIDAHPEVTFAHLRRWATDPDEHVRRLVSEGTRPRLPWAPRLRALQADPSPSVALLDLLHDDGSAYVRTSVANHLNDIARDHPELALATARRWLPAGERSRWVVRKGLRSLVKAGAPAALALLGIDPDCDVRLHHLALDPARVAIGEVTTLHLELALGPEEAEPREVVVDHRVHYQGANGPKAPKVFKLANRTLEPGLPLALSRRLRFAHVSIRQIRPGPHTIDVQVNGKVLGSVVLDVVDAPAGGVAPAESTGRRAGRTAPSRSPSA